MNSFVGISTPRFRALRLIPVLAPLCLLLTACEEPRPRSFSDFMEDRIAREGTISFCNQNPDDSASNIECANARRAAAAVALRVERERREELERESERKLEALRIEMAERERIVRETALAAARAEREAYEALWRNGLANEAGSTLPVGPVLPDDQPGTAGLPSNLTGTDPEQN